MDQGATLSREYLCYGKFEYAFSLLIHFDCLQNFQTLRANNSYIGSFRKMFNKCIKSAYKMQHFLFSNIWRGVACSIWKLILKITFLFSRFCLNWGQRLKSQTFQVFFCLYNVIIAVLAHKAALYTYSYHLKPQKVKNSIFLTLNFLGGAVQCVKLYFLFQVTVIHSKLM